MNTQLTYKTIASPCESMLTEKGSKFISYIYPVLDELDIQNHLQDIRALHPKATHHCYAYRLGYDGTRFRANDDGEPSGTAGRPILSQIDSFECTQILAIVVRYFGGIELGVSGLQKAYKQATRQTFEMSDIIEKDIQVKIAVFSDYLHMHQVMKVFKDLDAHIVSQVIDTDCQWNVILSLKNIEEFKSKLEKFCTFRFE